MLNTFDEVKNWYERTKPVREKTHGTSRDVRPIDERRYKERRIAKIDDNCYVLSDGGHYGSGIGWQPYTQGANYTPTTEDLVRFAPIVWRRAADGTETVAVRNAGYGSNTVASRHEFLFQHMPQGIKLWRGNNNGKHWLRAASGETFFPTATAVPQMIHDAAQNKRRYWARWLTLEDNATVTFRRDGAQFHLIGEALPEPMRRVDKETKGQYAQAIREFTDWTMVIVPMLMRSRQTFNDAFVAFDAWMRENGGHTDDTRKANNYRTVIADPQHEQRVNLVYILAEDILRDVRPWSQRYTPMREEEFKPFRAALTRQINKRCAFITYAPRITGEK